MLSILRHVLKCERATTPLEYTLIAALLGLAALQVSQLASGGSPVG